MKFGFLFAVAEFVLTWLTVVFCFRLARTEQLDRISKVLMLFGIIMAAIAAIAAMVGTTLEWSSSVMTLVLLLAVAASLVSEWRIELKCRK